MTWDKLLTKPLRQSETIGTQPFTDVKITMLNHGHVRVVNNWNTQKSDSSGISLM